MMVGSRAKSTFFSTIESSFCCSRDAGDGLDPLVGGCFSAGGLSSLDAAVLAVVSVVVLVAVLFAQFLP